MIVIITIYIFYREFNNCQRNRDRDMGHHEVNTGSGDSDGKLVIQPMSTPFGVVRQLEVLGESSMSN